MNIECTSRQGGSWGDVTVSTASVMVNETLGTTSEKKALLWTLLDCARELFDSLDYDDKARYACVKEYGFTKHLDDLVEDNEQ